MITFPIQTCDIGYLRPVSFSFSLSGLYLFSSMYSHNNTARVFQRYVLANHQISSTLALSWFNVVSGGLTCLLTSRLP
ncbi:hypothetical protein F5X96DRAFT_637417, partial [Biscogniauxia mediterranea]